MPTTTALAYGTVDCRILVASPDLADADARPDEQAPSGTVYLRARKDALSTTTLAKALPTIVLPDVIPLVIDADGYACVPDAEGKPTGQRTVDLPAVEGMTWQVSFDLTMPPYVWQTGVLANRVDLEPFDVPVVAGQTTHIADYLPLGADPSTGATWVKGDRGVGIASATESAGRVTFTLEDGRQLPAIPLPASTVPGPVSSIGIGKVESGTAPAASVSGEPGSQKLNLTLPQGKTGPPGAGIPDGGKEGQVPVRTAAGSTEWADLPEPVLNEATDTTAGLMPASDRVKLDKAAAAATPGVLMQRDAAGRAQVADPADDGDVVNRRSMAAAVDPVAQLAADASYGTVDAAQRFRVGAVWNILEADPMFWLQGVGLNASTSEIYAVYQLNQSPNTTAAIEVRDLDTAKLKSRKTFTTDPGAFTEAGSHFLSSAGDLCFVVRPAAANGAVDAKAAIFNYTTGKLGAQFGIKGQAKGDVQDGSYVTTDAWGTFASRFFVYDWKSVQNGAPSLQRTIRIGDAGTTIEKTQGLSVVNDKIYQLMGGGKGTPAVEVYNFDGAPLAGLLYDKVAFAKAINASRPGTIANTSSFVYECEGGTSYRGMLVSAHVIDQKAVLLFHGAQGSVRPALQPLPARSGWEDLPISDTAWTIPWGKSSFRTRNGQLELNGYVVNAGHTGGFTTIGTLPEYARPAQSAIFQIGANTTTSFSLRIETSGAIQMYSSEASSAWRCLNAVRIPLDA